MTPQPAATAESATPLPGPAPGAGPTPAQLDGGPPGALDYHDLPSPSRAFLDELLHMQVLARSSAGLFLRQSSDHLAELATPEALGTALVQAGALTNYQLDRVLAGTLHGMVLGNHRVLERLGAGSMGVVFLAEHMLLKRRVAVKVLPVDDDLPPEVLERFFTEMRVLADLHHPNIVLAFDAGKLVPANPGQPALLYLVMELVPGGDLEQHVVEHGPVPVAQACDWVRQAASGLQEAHDQHLIHRDVKPSNLLLTQDRRVKVVDFGLARQFCSRLTDPRAILGSIEFMAPEQSYDPSAVGGQADIYGLGATLLWLLSGQTPYPPEKHVARALRALQQNRPRRLRQLLPEAPPELDALIARMLDRDPQQRPALPVAVMNALARFAAPAAPAWEVYDPEAGVRGPGSGVREEAPGSRRTAAPGHTWRVLVVDDDPTVCRVLRGLLEALGCVCGEAGDGTTALRAARDEAYDLVLLDLHLPDIGGYEVCAQLRERPPRPHLKVLIVSGLAERHELTVALARGADDFVAKPFDLQELAAKVQYMLRLKDAQDRADGLARHLVLANRQLEHSLQARATDVRRAHDALLYAMAKLAESRDGETAGHMRRLQLYCRCLAERIAQGPFWPGVVSASFLDLLDRCVPLHDIGKLGLPDAVLCKPGLLDPAERALMQTHTLMGAGILDAIGREYGESLAFLAVATVIVRYHHERYDGAGYPDGLAGDSIPPAARLVALADVYDALRRKRFHKPPFPHAAAVQCILHESPGQFDPVALQAFQDCQDRFERVYAEVRG